VKDAGLKGASRVRP